MILTALIGTTAFLVVFCMLVRSIGKELDARHKEQMRDIHARFVSDVCEIERKAALRDGVEYDEYESRKKWRAWLRRGT